MPFVNIPQGDTEVVLVALSLDIVMESECHQFHKSWSPDLLSFAIHFHEGCAEIEFDFGEMGDTIALLSGLNPKTQILLLIY